MKLVHQLAREIKRKPGKAALLALLLLVAAWFWGPLAVKWFGSGKPPAEQLAKNDAAEMPVAAATESASGSASPAAVSSVGTSWRELAKRIESDARMRPWGAVRGDRNPFAAPREDQNEDQRQTESAAAGREAPIAAAAGQELTLDGTLGGQRRRVAIIKGKTYAVGDLVPGPTGVNWQVRKIEALAVVLMSGDRQLKLSLIGGTKESEVNVRTSE